MGRADYVWTTVRGIGGINQQVDLADPAMELLDARNVWAPDGRVVQRPGYVGVTGLEVLTTAGEVLSSVSVVKEDPIGTFSTTTTLSSLPVGSRWYFGFSAPAKQHPQHLNIGISNFNSAATWAAAEYWNGSTWAPVQTSEYTAGGSGFGGTPVAHLETGALVLVWPRDLATTTVNGLTKCWFRFTIQGANLDSSVVLSGTGTISESTDYTDGQVGPNLPIVIAQFPTTKRYISWGSTSIWGANSGRLTYSGEKASDLWTEALGAEQSSPGEPGTFAVVPQYGEVFIAYNRRMTVHRATPTAVDLILARVEADPTLVGPNAVCDRDTVLQLGSWPAAKYITFFNSRLWTANLEGSPYEIRWSAPEPAYKVWPTLSNAVIMEDDNSPITGMRGFQENLVVFKNDSIWQMVNIGEDINGFDTFKARRMVRGTGCVANSSIQEVNGHLIFLAEDGIYAWMGGTEIKKLSDKISSTIKRINPAQRAFSCAVNWKSKSLYLLAVAVDGSEFNNLVIVWDYKNNTWWLWDNIEATIWLADEDSADNEQLYFCDRYRSIFELGPSQTDHGTAITSYFTTHQIGSEDDYSKRLRRVELKSTNNSSSATVEVFRNDEPEGTSATFDYSDSTEASWSDFAYGEDSWTLQRDRLKAAGFLKPGEWFSATVTHSTKNTPFEMESLKLAYMPVGRR